MGPRILVMLLLFALASGGLLLLVDGEREPGVTLAELDARGSVGSLRQSGIPLGAVNGNDTVPIIGLEVEVIFYAVVGICAAVLMLGVLISLLQSVTERRRWSINPRREKGEAPTADSVVVPVYTRRAPQEDSIPFPAVSPMRLRNRVPGSAHGTFAHMVLTFAGIVAVFCLLTAGLVYVRLHRSLSEQILLRGRLNALNIGDGAAPYLLKNNAGAMRELLRKQAGQPAVAYILVEDRKQRIFAHSLATLHDELAKAGPANRATAPGYRVLRMVDGDVYELTEPILEGRAGSVRVGIWREELEQEIRRTIMPLMMWLIFITVGGALLAMFLAWRIYRPILSLASAARAISSGALDTPTPHVQDTGELGELSRAIERMRSSVKAAMVRLSR